MILARSEHSTRWGERIGGEDRQAELGGAGQPVVADDVAVWSPQVHTYTFETAPTDWAVESGNWQGSSRWSLPWERR